MSTLDVRVKTIDEVKPHPNADRLSIVVIGGWQCITGKDQFADDQPVVYFPPDTELPQEWTDRFGVTKYCSPVKSSLVGPNRYRIRQTKLRGEPSFGLVVGRDQLVPGDLLLRGPGGEDVFSPDEVLPVGQDVAALFKATKYEPPVKTTAGDAAPDHPLFIKYTEIENLRNYPDLLLPEERLVVTEKLHGSSSRSGLIEGVFMAGSKGLRRKEPVDPETGLTSDALLGANTYWYPLSLSPVADLLKGIAAQGHKQVILFGEVYGQGIQKLDYGTRRGFRGFDLYVDGHYLDADPFFDLCLKYGVETVPILARFDWNERGMETVRRLSTGRAFSGNHIKEGVVIRPEHERTDSEIGRVVLKFLGDDYLLGNYEDFTDQ